MFVVFGLFVSYCVVCLFEKPPLCGGRTQVVDLASPCIYTIYIFK